MAAGVYFITAAIEKAGIDKHQALPSLIDAGLQVHTGAPLLIHNADLESVFGQSQCLFDTAEQLDREGHFGRAVQLGFDHIDTAGSAVAAPLQIVDRRQAGNHAVQNRLRNRITLGIEHRVGQHMMTDMTNKHQAAPD